MKKNYFSSCDFYSYVLVHISVPLLVLITDISFNFGGFLKFWENPDSKMADPQMAAIWQSWPNYHVI